jgi:hypothetical protein
LVSDGALSARDSTGQPNYAHSSANPERDQSKAANYLLKSKCAGNPPKNKTLKKLKNDYDNHSWKLQ